MIIYRNLYTSLFLINVMSVKFLVNFLEASKNIQIEIR